MRIKGSPFDTPLGKVKSLLGDKAKRTERRRVADDDSVHPILQQTRLQVLRSPSPNTCCTEGKIEKVHEEIKGHFVYFINTATVQPTFQGPENKFLSLKL